MFTLSAVHGAHKALFAGVTGLGEQQMIDTATSMWEALNAQFPEWAMIRAREVHAPEIRRDFIHTHGILLTALGRVCNTLLLDGVPCQQWPQQLQPLSLMDWSRTNTALWEGRALVGGVVSKSSSNIVLTTAALRSHLGMTLSAEEEKAEQNRKAQS